MLKVMDKEEIEKYAQKTAEIRAQRRLLIEPDPQHQQPPLQIEQAGHAYEEATSGEGRSVRF